MRVIQITCAVLVSCVLVLNGCSPRSGARGPSFSDLTRGLDKREGFFDIYVSKSGGKILARLPKPDENNLSLELIHANSLAAGLGSNPVGLDRGLTTNGQILAFRKIGGNVVAEIVNTDFRATRDDVAEQESVRRSFAKSYIWSTPILANAGNGDLLIDLSSFLTSDSMGIVKTLSDAGQGNFNIAKDRSFAVGDTALAFPDNVELEGDITFTSDAPGGEVVSTAADGRAVTLSVHHSFVRLPDDEYSPRLFDPRTAGIDVPYYDFSAELEEPIKTVYARRFRLQRATPTAASGPVKKPIVFYVDRGAPDPVRSALIDGASWWADAFAEAGFEDAFRVEILPEDAHPLDIRYNIIQWTHRQTRGWSYGGGISDPRTGEMLKAHVILGSQRVRQDRMIFEGLTGTSATGTGRTDDPLEIALSRIRQLSAHEVGHTLGFAHNFAASTIDRASVMDYPAPDVKVTDKGLLDFSTAYDSGIGEWDKFTVRWLYAEFSPEVDETEALKRIVERGYEKGLRFVSDRHARSPASAHPDGSLWDNGSDPVAALEKDLAVRAIALENFDLSVIRIGQPRARMAQVLVPIYLYHRYQVEAAAKLVGGYRFSYSVSGDGFAFDAPVPVETQRKAIEVLLSTLDPAMLQIPERILLRLSPPVGTFNATRGAEVFDSHLREVFDPLAAADSAASLTLRALLQPTRLARMLETNRREKLSPSYEELLTALNFQLFEKPVDEKNQMIARRLQTRFVSMLMELARNKSASPEVRAETEAYLLVLQSTLSNNLAVDNSDPASNHRAWLLSLLSSHLNRDENAFSLENSGVNIPAGSPIGTAPTGGDFREDCWHCDTRL